MSGLAKWLSDAKVCVIQRYQRSARCTGNPIAKTLRAEAAAAFPIEEDTALLPRRASLLYFPGNRGLAPAEAGRLPSNASCACVT